MSCRYLLIAFLTCCITACSKPKETAVEEKPLFVKFETVSERPVSQSFETAGEIKADQEVLVSAERQGRIDAIYVKEGQSVNAGQILLKVKGEDVSADLKKAQTDYEAYKKLYEAGAVSQLEFAQYQANLSRVNAQVNNLVITAITSGTIGQIYVDPGDYVLPGAKILDLVKLYPLRLSYSIPEQLLSYVKLGQPLSFTTDAYPGESFSGVVDFISPRVEPLTRNILVRATVNDPGKKLKANQFTKVKQEIKNIPNALMIREEAIYLDQGAEYVFIADTLSDNNGSVLGFQAKKLSVTTGLREPGWVEIVDGVKAGDNVIYAGLTSIYDGAKVTRVEE